MSKIKHLICHRGRRALSSDWFADRFTIADDEKIFSRTLTEILTELDNRQPL